MKKIIKTSQGMYVYKFKPLYPGIKPIDKEIAKENLFLLRDLCYSHQVYFLLFFGTLLGAVREKDFIAHDEDIDLALLKEDLPRFLELLFELRRYGFEVVRYEERGFLSVIRKGEYIDLYFFDTYLPDSRYRYLARDIVFREHVEEKEEVVFLDGSFYVPKDAVGFLASYYGDNWRTPVRDFDFNMSRLDRMKAYTIQYLKALLPPAFLRHLQEKKDMPLIHERKRILDERKMK